MIVGNRTRFEPRVTVDTSPAATFLARFLLVLFILLPFGALTPSGEGSDDTSALLQPVWALVYIASIIGLLIERRRSWPLIKNSLPIVAILVLVVASSFWSDYHDISLKRALELVGTTAAAYFIVSHFQLLAFLECWAVAVGAAAVASFGLIVADPARGLMQEEYPGTWRGIFNHKNALGQAMILGILTIVIVAYANDRKGRPKTLAFAGAALSLILLVGSQSATSYLVFAVLALFLGFYAIAISSNARRIMPALLTAGALALVVIAFNVDTVIGLLGRDSTLSGRTDIWEPVVEAIRARPWFGYGYDTFWLPDGTGSAYLPVLIDWAPWTAHQGLLELSLDIGLVGTGIFVMTLLIGLRRAWTYMRGSRDMARFWPLLAIIYFMTSNITEANIAKFNGTNWLVFLIAFLFVSVPRTPKIDRKPL